MTNYFKKQFLIFSQVTVLAACLIAVSLSSSLKIEDDWSEAQRELLPFSPDDLAVAPSQQVSHVATLPLMTAAGESTGVPCCYFAPNDRCR